ncbi:MAG: hypothetical protein ABIJ16_12210 [Bacteroidota bacterium]
MELIIHRYGEIYIAELKDTGVLISETCDAPVFMANAGYLGAGKIIVRKEQLASLLF